MVWPRRWPQRFPKPFTSRAEIPVLLGLLALRLALSQQSVSRMWPKRAVFPRAECYCAESLIAHNRTTEAFRCVPGWRAKMDVSVVI